MKAKRQLSLLLAAVMALGSVNVALAADNTVPAQAEEERVSAYAQGDYEYPVVGGNIYFDKSTGEITKCDTTVTSADIPSTIDGVKVTTIGSYAFSYCRKLTSITIPEGVTSIENDAFYYCDALTELILPNSIESLGECAFMDCQALTKVKLPNHLTAINNSVFIRCYKLTDITLPDTVTSIGKRAFYSCISLEKLRLPEGIAEIGDQFVSTDKTTLYLKEGSFAEEHCKASGYDYMYQLIGNVNGDKTVDNKDAAVILKAVTNSTDLDLLLADYDNDGDINLLDVIGIIKDNK